MIKYLLCLCAWCCPCACWDDIPHHSRHMSFRRTGYIEYIGSSLPQALKSLRNSAPRRGERIFLTFLRFNKDRSRGQLLLERQSPRRTDVSFLLLFSFFLGLPCLFYLFPAFSSSFFSGCFTFTSVTGIRLSCDHRWISAGSAEVRQSTNQYIDQPTKQRVIISCQIPWKRCPLSRICSNLFLCVLNNTCTNVGSTSTQERMFSFGGKYTAFLRFLSK